VSIFELASARAAAGDAAKLAAADRPVRSAAELLDAAFANRYDVDLTSNIELLVSDQSGATQRRLVRAAQKVIGDKVHSIGRLEFPEYLRGMTVLTVEAIDRGHDAFLYMPSLDRVRRVSTAQKGDSFFGTDVTYEDLERHSASAYELGEMRREERGGKPVIVIPAKPKRPQNYERTLFVLSAEEDVMLEHHFFKRLSKTPWRIIYSPRDKMEVLSGHLLPTYLYVDNLERKTRTEVWLRDLRVDVKLSDKVFSVKNLEAKGPIPGS
jgi:hypothetical protein